MPKLDEASVKLEKLFKLEFYKKQDRWKLKSNNSNTKSNASDTNEEAKINESTKEKNSNQATDDDKPITVAQSVDQSNDHLQKDLVEDDTPSQPVKCHQSVSNRLHVFVTLIHKMQAESNNSEANVDSAMSVEGVPLNCQDDLNANVVEKNILMDEATPSYYAETSMTNQVLDYDGDSALDITIDAADVNNPYSTMQTFIEPHMNMESASFSQDNGYVKFMREAHDAAHSSNVQLDFPDATSSYYPETAMTDQLLDYDRDSEHETTRDNMQAFIEPHMNMESANFTQDNSYVKFMREAHDAAHSSNVQLDFQYGPDDIDSQRLAELSPGQLWLGLNRYAGALQKLVQETNFRKLLFQERQYQSLCPHIAEEDTILSASAWFYTVDTHNTSA